VCVCVCVCVSVRKRTRTHFVDIACESDDSGEWSDDESTEGGV